MCFRAAFSLRVELALQGSAKYKRGTALCEPKAFFFSSPLPQESFVVLITGWTISHLLISVGRKNKVGGQGDLNVGCLSIFPSFSLLAEETFTFWR